MDEGLPKQFEASESVLDNGFSEIGTFCLIGYRSPKLRGLNKIQGPSTVVSYICYIDLLFACSHLMYIDLLNCKHWW